MISAREAHNVAVNSVSVRSIKQLKNINIHVRQEMYKGNLSLVWGDALYPETKRQLIKLGYTVEECTHRNETSTTISWSL